MNQRYVIISIVFFYIFILIPFLFNGCSQQFGTNTIEEETNGLPELTDKPVPLDALGVIHTEKPVFRWLKAVGADNYRLMVAHDPDMDYAGNVIDVVVRDTSYSPTVSFENGKTYWWKVKARTGNEPGKWSEIVSFTVSLSGPDGLTLLSDILPAPYPKTPEGTILGSSPVIFSWDDVTGADHYELSVINPDDSIAFGPVEVTGTRYEMENRLDIDVNLRWKVTAVSSGGVPGYSSDSLKTMYFTVTFVPPQPSDRPFILGPRGVISTSRPTFCWVEALDSDNYWLIVADGYDISESLHLINTIVWDTRYESPVTFENGKTYYWKVKSKKGDVPGNWSAEIVSFTVDTGEPPPTLLSPPFPIYPEGSIDDLTPTFRWSPVQGADHYELYVMKPDDSIALGLSYVKETYITPVTPLPSHVSLRWRVRAVDACGKPGLYSDSMKAMYFTITSDRLPAPYPIGPEGIIYNRFPRFEWKSVERAASYCLFVLRPDDSFAIGPVYTSNTFYIHDHSLATNKTFRWKVKPYDTNDSSGYYSDSIRQMYFTILEKPDVTPPPGDDPTVITGCTVYVSLSPSKTEYKKEEKIDIGSVLMCSLPDNEHTTSIQYDLIGSSSRLITNPWIVDAEPGTYRIKVTLKTNAGNAYSGESFAFRIAGPQSNPCLIRVDLIPSRSEYLVGERIEMKGAVSCDMSLFSPKFELIGTTTKLLTNPWVIDVDPGTYLIKLTLTGEDGKPYSGESPVFGVVENLPSEIVNIRISPNPVAPGDSLSISWNYGEQQSFELVLYRNSDLSNPYAQIIRVTGGENRCNRFYTWGVPDDFMPGDYRILVRGTGNNNIVKEKLSDVFTIQSIIELTHVILEPDPASVGQTVTARWTSRGQVKFELKICKHRSLWFDQTEVVKEGTNERSHSFDLPRDWGDGTYYAEVKVWNQRGDEKKMQSGRIDVR